MKKINLIRFGAVVSLFAILFSSCTKDSLSKPNSQVQPASRHITSNMNISDPNPVTIDWAGVRATIVSSSVRNSLVVKNDNFTSAETFADQNGNVFISNVPEGAYTAIAHSYTYSFISPGKTVLTDNTIVINNVKVIDGQITDLGTITFQ